MVRVAETAMFLERSHLSEEPDIFEKCVRNQTTLNKYLTGAAVQKQNQP